MTGSSLAHGRRSILDDIAKPKSMRWATFDREMQKVEAVEATVNGHLWAFVQKLNQRLGR